MCFSLVTLFFVLTASFMNLVMREVKKPVCSLPKKVIFPKNSSESGKGVTLQGKSLKSTTLLLGDEG